MPSVSQAKLNELTSAVENAQADFRTAQKRREAAEDRLRVFDSILDQRQAVRGADDLVGRGDSLTPSMSVSSDSNRGSPLSSLSPRSPGNTRHEGRRRRDVKRLLCWFLPHDWQPKSFVSEGPADKSHTGTGRECSRCGKYVLLTWNHESADWP